MKLPFKSADAFMEYCNSTFRPEPIKMEGRPALIPPKGFMQIENHVSRTPDGRYRVSLIVCGAPAGFFAMSETAQPSDVELAEGDLVVWQAFNKPLFGKSKIGRFTGDKRSNWFGFVVAKIAPEIDMETGKFNILGRFQ